MKNNRSFCFSISMRNKEVVDLIEEYSEMFGLSKAKTVFYMLKEYPKLKANEKERELEQVRQKRGCSLMPYEKNKTVY